jgi:hypothetical protein
VLVTIAGDEGSARTQVMAQILQVDNIDDIDTRNFGAGPVPYQTPGIRLYRNQQIVYADLPILQSALSEKEERLTAALYSDFLLAKSTSFWYVCTRCDALELENIRRLLQKKQNIYKTENICILFIA